MAIINLLDDYRGKKTKKNNIDNLIENKLTENIEKTFEEELFMERFLIAKVLEKNDSKKSIQQRIDNLKEIETKYFSMSNNLENKITLINCFALMSKKYYIRLIDYVNNHLKEILEEGKINWTIAIFENLNTNEEKMVKYITYLKGLKSGKLQLDHGEVTHCYGDIQSSISVASEYSFQKA